MKVAIVKKEKEGLEGFRKELERHFTIVSENPDLVLSIGGDGTVLYSERQYPGVPKLMIRDKSICRRCDEEEIGDIAEKLSKHDYDIEKRRKLEATATKGGREIRKLAANDIVVRNDEQIYALRFRLDVDGKVYDEMIGDGIVVSTPFGSGGYFYSITRKDFSKGIGIAFNNTTEEYEHLILDDPVIEMRILRNRACVSADNDQELIRIDQDGKVQIRQSDEIFRLIRMRG